MDRIYLDNAATSWPKPPQVLEAIQDFYQSIGSASGRGNQASEFTSDHLVRQCRVELAEFLGVGNQDSLVFGFNGTDAINMALWGFLRPDDHVVTTVIEHNSVIRPLNELNHRQRVRFDVVDCDQQGRVDVDSICSAIKSETRLVVVSHASNVTGVVQDVRGIAEICQKKGVSLMVDAAQTVGQVEVNFRELGCDLLAAPGHKGLMGPLGTGILLVGEKVKSQMGVWRAGGTGTDSELTTQPSDYPARLESGNLNVGGIAGLLAGLRFVQSIGIEKIAAKENELIEFLARELNSIDGVRVFGGLCDTSRVAVLSFEIAGMDPREVAMILDSSFGIQVRAGLHCAPGIHQRLGTFARGGTIRCSPGWFTEPSQVGTFLAAVKEISESI